MKTLFTLLSIYFLSIYKEYALLNQSVPNFTGKTLEGEIIDSSFFIGKVTVLNFMALGCEPCMKELPFHHELDSSFNKNSLQLLCIAPHSRERLLLFNSNMKSQYSTFRKEIGVKPIKIKLMPECEITIKSPDDDKNHLTLLHDCEDVSSKFNVEAYPMTFIIDTKGIIRNIHFGYPMNVNDSVYKNEIRNEIEYLLK